MRESSTVLCIGRLVAQKGVDLLLEAWRRLGQTGLELVLVGDGPLRPGLEQLRVPGVHFTGHLPTAEVRSQMLAGRALVFPSRSYEGQPLVIVEALAAGLPVLCRSSRPISAACPTCSLRSAVLAAAGTVVA